MSDYLTFPDFGFNLLDNLDGILEEFDDNELLTSVQETEKEIQEKPRFASLKDSDLNDLVENAQSKGTKKATKWSTKAFEGNYKMC